jgi:hypothetical protein
MPSKSHRVNPTASTLTQASPYLRPLPRDLELEADPLPLWLDLHRGTCCLNSELWTLTLMSRFRV